MYSNAKSFHAFLLAGSSSGRMSDYAVSHEHRLSLVVSSLAPSDRLWTHVPRGREVEGFRLRPSVGWSSILRGCVCYCVLSARRVVALCRRSTIEAMLLENDPGQPDSMVHQSQSAMLGAGGVTDRRREIIVVRFDASHGGGMWSLIVT